jgi:hypothetical protein
MERDRLEDTGVGKETIFKCILKKLDWSECTGFICLRIGSNVSLL